MMNVFRLVPLVIAWLPHVIAAVSVVEAVFGSGKSGVEKRELVLSFLRRVSSQLGLPWGDRAVEAVALTIDAVVGILNLVGTFRHASAVEEDVAAASVVVARASVGSAVVPSSPNAIVDVELAEFERRMRVTE
jgi:hypothetical protein